MTARDRLIVALDAGSLAEAIRLAKSLKGLAGTLKIGSVLFTRSGPEAVRRIRALGFRVMLDLKYHDIPNTVEHSCEAAAELGVSLLTVHAGGGRDMVAAAVRGVSRAPRGRRPKVLGVTILTSTAAHDRTARGRETISKLVAMVARPAVEGGCDGLVASAHEAGALRKRFGAKLLLVCPGIRSAGDAAGDQQRIATPAEALANGADMLVIGRPIIAAADPKAAARRILVEMETAT